MVNKYVITNINLRGPLLVLFTPLFRKILISTKGKNDKTVLSPRRMLGSHHQSRSVFMVLEACIEQMCL